MILVYHSKDTDSMRHDGGEYNMCDVLLARFDADDGSYEAVADVGDDDFNDLEVAFHLTNNVDSSWAENEGVEAKQLRARSTSVGDIFVAQDAIYLVAPFGFDLLRKFAG